MAAGFGNVMPGDAVPATPTMELLTPATISPTEATRELAAKIRSTVGTFNPMVTVRLTDAGV